MAQANSNNDDSLDDMTDHSHTDNIVSRIYHNHNAQISNRLEELAQSSKLQVISTLFLITTFLQI